MRKFTTAKHDCNFDFVSFFHKTPGIFQLNIKIVLLDIRSEFYFFNRYDFLFFARFFFAFLLFVTIFSEVHDFTDGRSCFRCDFNEIEMSFFGKFQCVPRLHDSELLSVFVGDPDFTNTNFFVDSQTVSANCKYTSRGEKKNKGDLKAARSSG